jgi:hypothetical protein
LRRALLLSLLLSTACSSLHFIGTAVDLTIHFDSGWTAAQLGAVAAIEFSTSGAQSANQTVTVKGVSTSETIELRTSSSAKGTLHIAVTATDAGGATLGTGSVDASLSSGNAVRADVSVVGTPSPPLDMAMPCIDISNTAPTIQEYAAAGSAPASTGGVISDGLYLATALQVYGTPAAAGSVVGTFQGATKIMGTTFETIFSSTSSAGPMSFSGRGTAAVSGTNINVSYACEAGIAPPSTYGYSATGANTLIFTIVFSTYTSVITYSK